nr:hypothetical protein [Tanacetum cinerariifolium]
MKTKRKLVLKSIGNDPSQHTGTGNVGLETLLRKLTVGLENHGNGIGPSKRQCIRDSNLVFRDDSTLRIQETQKLVSKSTGNDVSQHMGTGNVGLENHDEHIGCSKRQCIREPNLVFHGDSTLRIQETPNDIDHIIGIGLQNVVDNVRGSK